MKYLKGSILAFCVCILFAACKKDCIHEYQSEITQPASCNQEGVETFTCVHCQESFIKPISALGHAYTDEKVEKEPTCAEDGCRVYACAQCGSKKSEPIEKLAHTFGELAVTKEPNCTEQGERSGICTVCGIGQVVEKIETNDAHELINMVVREATCTDPGEGVNICNRCQYKESCVYDLKEHTYGDAETITSATCTSAGTRKYSCTGCDHIIEESVAATGHKWMNATCTREAVCSVCYITGDKAEHDFVVTYERKPSDHFAGVCELKCDSCGLEKKEYSTKKHKIDLDEINAALGEYAESLGFEVCLDSFYEDYDYHASMDVFFLNLEFNAQQKLIDKGKSCLDTALRKHPSPPPHIGKYTAHIHASYWEWGGLGTGYFGVQITITS